MFTPIRSQFGAHGVVSYDANYKSLQQTLYNVPKSLNFDRNHDFHQSDIDYNYRLPYNEPLNSQELDCFDFDYSFAETDYVNTKIYEDYVFPDLDLGTKNDIYHWPSLSTQKQTKPIACVNIKKVKARSPECGSKKIGSYTMEERKDRIKRFLEKRKSRRWTKSIKYACRKRFADNRIRVKGRFVSSKEMEQLESVKNDSPSSTATNFPIIKEKMLNSYILRI